MLGQCNDEDCPITHAFEIPPLPASEWLKFLLSKDPDINALILNLMPELEDFYAENELSIDEMYRVALDVIATVSARSWWIALRLIYLAADNWHIIGSKLILNHVDATVVSLSAWLDVVLYLAIESMDPKDVNMFTMRLEIAPPMDSPLSSGEPEPEPVMDRRAFLAMA